MKKYLLFCVISTVTFNCAGQFGHRPSLLGGLLSGAHEIGHKVHDALEGLAHGNVNLNFQGNVNGAHHNHHGHQHPPSYPNGGHKPEQPETIIVVVEEEPQQNTYGSYGQGPQSNYGFRPEGNNNNKPNFLNKPGHYGYNSNYNYNVQWGANHQRPGYGQFPQGNNNNGNINPNQNNGNTGNLPNYNAQTGNTNTNNPNGGYVNPSNYGNTNMNHGNTNLNHGNTNPNHYGNTNSNNYGNTNPNHYGNTNSNNYGNTNPNHNGNIPTQPPFAEPNQNESDNQNKPTNGIPTDKPTGNNNFGTVYDPTKENEDKKPNNEFIEQQNHKDQTTKKPVEDDKPLFVPLNPNQYTYGGDKIEINAPKRETNASTKPVEDEDSESYPIDIRFGDKPQ